MLKKNKAVFLDRDGVIVDIGQYRLDNKKFILSKDELTIFNFAARAISMLKRNGFKVVIITNQPQIAFGIATEEKIEEINSKMKKILEKMGAKIDAIYYCPHHPQAKNKEYGINCDCRKPAPGMLIRAAREHSINLKESFLIGDRTGDLKAGNLAGCKTVAVKTGYGCKDGFKDVVPDFIAENALEAAKIIIKQNK